MHNLFVPPCASARGRSRDRAIRRTVLSLLLGAAAGIGQAAEAPPFAALLGQAQEQAPQLLEQAANVRAAGAETRQAGAWLNPTLSINADNLGAPRVDGASQREDTFTVTQSLELGAKRSARIAAERSKYAAAGARERYVCLAFGNELAMAYATAEAMQQRSDVATAELARASDDLRAAEALVKAGREADLRLAQARASRAAAQAGVAAASANATEALERLSALVGAAEPFTRIGHPFMASVAAYAVQADWTPARSPVLASAAAERDVVAAQVRVEEKRWIPDVAVSVGMRRYGWTNERAGMVGVSAAIPIFDRNQAGLDAARERLAGASQKLEASRLDALASHRAAVAQAQASELRLKAAEEGESAAAEAYRLGRLGYEAGKTALTELLATRRALSEATLSTIEARLARVRAIAALSLAEGRNLFGVAP